MLGYFFVKSVRHNADDQKMTLDIDEDKEKNKETETDNGLSGIETDANETDESTGGESE